MRRTFSWFYNKNNSHPTTIARNRKDLIKSFIVHKQIKEFSSCLRQKDDQAFCIEGFFQLLPSILDENYMSNLFEIITKQSRLTSKQLSTIITTELSNTIHNKDFDLCERILHLPFQSLKISLPTYEIIQLIHHCSNFQQTISCLSILIEKNLPYDSEYLSWILIILFEYYQIGDEIIIEYLLNIKKNINLLFTCYGNNNVTPLMLFLHLYSNQKCQILIDQYLSNITNQSILLQSDKWNRSYLMHLLCGQCQHEFDRNSSDQCPHTSAVLSTFSMLYKLGNRCDTPIKTILISRYCLPLQIVLFNYLLENDSSIKLKFEEFFQHFPSNSIPIHSNYLKRLVHNHNLNSTLAFLILHRTTDNDSTIKFLLQQGARIDNMNSIHHMIIDLLAHGHSMIPFLLLDYSLYIDIPFDTWLSQQTPRMSLYISRILQCGYPSEFRTKFEEFKSHLPEQTVKFLEKFINLKNPSRLSSLCFQKLRSSLKDLGDETLDELKNNLSKQLRQSILLYGHAECRTYFQSVVLLG